MSRVITGDTSEVKTEYAVVLPNGDIVTDTYKLGLTYQDDDHISHTYDAAQALKLADIFNARFTRMGAIGDAVPVTRSVVTTYSDWTEVPQ